MKLCHVIALAVTATAWTGPVPASAQQGVNNARCFLLSNLFVQRGPPQGKAIALRSSYFYLGRLSGSPAQLEAEFAAQAKTLTSQNSGVAMNACAVEMGRREQEVRAIGTKMRPPNAR